MNGRKVTVKYGDDDVSFTAFDPDEGDHPLGNAPLISSAPVMLVMGDDRAPSALIVGLGTGEKVSRVDGMPFEEEPRVVICEDGPSLVELPLASIDEPLELEVRDEAGTKLSFGPPIRRLPEDESGIASFGAVGS